MRILGQRLSRHVFVGTLLGSALAFPLVAVAVAPVIILQQGRAFSAQNLTIAAGTPVRFTNSDDFPHQIHVGGPGILYDSDLQEPGQTINVAFPNRGAFEVRCGIHPRMRMTIQVGSGT